MQFKVPQNVQLEDKILPFMTLRQLIISGIGGGFAYLVYLSLETHPMVVWLPPTAVIGLITAAVAFLKINGIPFVQFVLYVLERYLLETKRYWIKQAGDVHIRQPIFATDADAPAAIAPQKKLDIDDLDRLSRAVDAADAHTVVATIPTSHT